MPAEHRTENVRPPAPRRTPYVRWSFYLLCICLGLLLLQVAGVGFWVYRGAAGTEQGASGSLTGELRRELAGKLLGAGLKKQAIQQYERYLSEGRLSPQRRAGMAFTLGKLYMEEGLYEEALGWLYQVEMLDPKTDLASEVGSKVVACLEKLGRFAQAQYSLEARSALDGEASDEFKGGEVVARIGKEAITLADLNEARDALPEWMQRSLSDPKERESFLKQYVAERLLYRKAKRLEIDKDPSIRKQADRALRGLMVQKLLEGELQDKVKVMPDDLALYYKAHADRYDQQEGYRIRMLQVLPEASLEPVLEALGRGESFGELARRHSLHKPTRDQGGEVAEWIEPGMDPTGMGDPDKLWQVLSGHKEGEIVGPLKTAEACYLFQVIAYRPHRRPGFEEVREQVAKDIYQERVQKTYQELIDQALASDQVKFFPEVMEKAFADEAGSQESEVRSQNEK